MNQDPKQKANEIYEKIYWIKNEAPIYFISRNQAKQCALICVDEILNAIKVGKTGVILDLEYWQEVRKEILNIKL